MRGSPRTRGEPASGAAERGRGPLESALALLALRSHSRRELELKLLRRGYEPGEVGAAIGRLGELGYLDDAAYAQALVAARARRRGPAAIAAELRAKGVGRGAVDAALAGLDAADVQESALAVARRLLREPARREDRQRAAATLVRRGFSFDVARAAVDAAAGERPTGLD